MRMRVMVVIAAVPRARTVIAAAGVLRAAFVVDTQEGILADTLVAGAILAAIPIIAALGAGVSLGIPVLTADEPVATIELGTAVATGRGNFQETTVVSHVLAAIGHWRADTRIADLAVAAVAIVAARGAVAAVT
jgi:hypothetical protein